jgi:hypothetical protein
MARWDESGIIETEIHLRIVLLRIRRLRRGSLLSTIATSSLLQDLQLFVNATFHLFLSVVP